MTHISDTNSIKKDFISIVKNNELFHLENEVIFSDDVKYTKSVKNVINVLKSLDVFEEEKQNDIISFLKQINSHLLNKPWTKLKLEQKKDCLETYIKSQGKIMDQKQVEHAIDQILDTLKKNKKSIEIDYDPLKGKINTITFNDEPQSKTKKKNAKNTSD